MKSGFTLVEVIAVVAIIGVLSIMILPKVIDSLHEATHNSMIVSENEVIDAANLYVEDYCRNPIDSTYRTNCNNDRKTINSTTVYFCLSTVQGRGYIKSVYFEDTTPCKGIITYNYVNGKYNYPKVYLFCENDYSTDGGSSYKTYANGC